MARIVFEVCRLLLHLVIQAMLRVLAVITLQRVPAPDWGLVGLRLRQLLAGCPARSS